MEEIKSIIARNIARLRAAAGWTQLDLAQKLHYSDKAVSKWERAESVPEIGTLISIAELFEVPLDSLVRAEYKPQINSPEPARRKKQNRRHERAARMADCALCLCVQPNHSGRGSL